VSRNKESLLSKMVYHYQDSGKTHGLHHQALASQDRSEVVRGGIAIRIFFKSLLPESVRTRPECNLVKP
jgi:hypothetical protein